MIDIIYKLSRKALKPGLYKRFSRSFFGRTTAYHKPETYLHIYDHYRDEGLVFENRVVLEIGPGNQFFTALCYLAEGARQVILVDPSITPESFSQNIQAFNKTTGKNLSASLESRVSCYPDLQFVPDSWNAGIDLICSHQVLEHFSELESFFVHNQRLLASSGISYNRVDLSDHTYHIFDRFRFTHSINRERALFHLRYSKKIFDLLNDQKCFMNRILLPTYLDLAKKYGLGVKKLRTYRYKQIPVHPELLSGSLDPELYYVSGFSLTLTPVRTEPS